MGNNTNRERSPLRLSLSGRDTDVLTIEVEDNENGDNENDKNNKDRDKGEIIYNEEIEDEEEGPYSRGSGVFKKRPSNASEAKDNSLSIEGRAALADLNN